MKRKKLILPLILSGAFLLASCDEAESLISQYLGGSETNSSEVVSEESNAEIGSSVIAEESSFVEESSVAEEAGWPTELVNLIKEHFDDSLPYVQLDEDTLEYYYDVDDYGEYIGIGDCSETNLLEGYGDILADNDFEYLGEYSDEDCGIIFYYYSNGHIEVQYYFDPGDEEYASGNFIAVYPVEEIDPEDEGEWPEDLVNLISEYYDDTLPYVQLESDTFDYGAYEDEDGDYIYIGDCSEENLLDGYYETLEDAGFEYLGYSEDEYYGCIYYFFTNGNIEIEYFFFEGNDYYYPGNTIYVWEYSEDDPEETYWYSDFIEYGYTYTEEALTCDFLNDTTGLDIEFILPEYDEAQGFVYYAAAEYINVYFNETIAENFYSEAKEAGYDIVVSSGWTIDWETYEYVEQFYYYITNPDHDVVMTIYDSYGYTILEVYPFSSNFVDTLSEDEEWNEDIVANLSSIGLELPFATMGSNVYFTTEYLEDYGCYTIEDSYFGFTLEDYGDELKEAGFVLEEDEDSDYYGCYYAEQDGNEFYISFYWNVGNVIDIYWVNAPAGEGEFKLDSADQVTVNTEEQVVFTNGAYSVTFNRGTAQAKANNPINVSFDAYPCYKGGNVVFGWTEEASFDYIVVTLDFSSDRNHNLDDVVITGGEVISSIETDTYGTYYIEVDEEATSVTFDCTNSRIAIISVQFIITED